MTTQKQIRQTFNRQQERLCSPEKNSWLIKGDFDHFKSTNDLYGYLIADYLLDWTFEVIEKVIKIYQKQWGLDGILCNVVGDDVTIYIPPSTRTEDEIAQLLWKIRAAINESFWQRYMVGTLPIPPELFGDISPESLAEIRIELEKKDVVMDFAVRKRGFLLLLPVGVEGQTRSILNEVIQILQRVSGKPVPPVDLCRDWICDPVEDIGYSLNNGFVDPPLVSFAACSTRMAFTAALDPEAGAAGLAIYERVSLLCQSALRLCKQRRGGVLIAGDLDCVSGLPVKPAAIPPVVSSTQLKWSSERYLREILYFKPLDQPVLFKFNPVYAITSRVSTDVLKIEKFRGNAFGIGLKGINETFGQSAADDVIRLLISTFSAVIQSALAEKGISPKQVFLAQFVDRFTVCCEQPIFQLSEIMALVGSLIAKFNTVSTEIKVSHLRTSVIQSDTPVLGYRLFNQLALTNLSPQVSNMKDLDPRLEVRQNGSDALREGSLTLERNSFFCAKLRSAHTWSHLANP